MHFDLLLEELRSTKTSKGSPMALVVTESPGAVGHGSIWLRVKRHTNNAVDLVLDSSVRRMCDPIDIETVLEW